MSFQKVLMRGVKYHVKFGNSVFVVTRLPADSDQFPGGRQVGGRGFRLHPDQYQEKLFSPTLHCVIAVLQFY